MDMGFWLEQAEARGDLVQVEFPWGGPSADRSNIVSEPDLSQATSRLVEYVRTQPSNSTVVPLAAAAGGTGQ
jgi:hypothetical protein